MASVNTSCFSKISDQSESVHSIAVAFLVSYWWKVLFSPVPVVAAVSLGVIGRRLLYWPRSHVNRRKPPGLAMAGIIFRKWPEIGLEGSEECQKRLLKEADLSICEERSGRNGETLEDEQAIEGRNSRI
jgi:hypothetical protein